MIRNRKPKKYNARIAPKEKNRIVSITSNIAYLLERVERALVSMLR